MKKITYENFDAAIKQIEEEGNYLDNCGDLWSIIGEDGFYVVEPNICKEDVIFEYFHWNLNILLDQ